MTDKRCFLTGAAAFAAAFGCAAAVFAESDSSTAPHPHSKPFFTSLGEEFDEPLNRMWRIYGSVTDGTNAVIKFGNEPAWFEWMPRKLMWTDEFTYRSGFYNRIVQFPMSENGYIWSWGNQPKWPTAPGSYHQENNAKFILGVYRYFVWTQSDAFLETKDPQRIEHETRDVSQGMTVLEKARLAMRYQLEELQGRDGLLVIDNDHNTGLPDGHPTNYWDNFPFGYKDAYINAYFFASLLAMVEIEEHVGEKETARRYRGIAAETRRRFQETFWDEEKGRFIGCIDIEGNRRDLGFTFVNLEALAYSLGNDEKAEAIFLWLDGDRIVEGDTSQGEDIYYFGFAPRATTVDVVEMGEPYWWKSIVIDGVPQITVWEGGSAEYGEHLENGGAIFYVSHYDVLARAKYRGADDAWRRFRAIMDEFAIDELRRDPTNNVGANWRIGITGVFPESGLVPASFLYAFLGIDASIRGLRIAPNLPSELEYAGVRDLSIGNGLYDIRVERERIEILPTLDEWTRLRGVAGNMKPDTRYVVRVEHPATGRERIYRRHSGGEGEVEFDVDATRGLKIVIEPEGER